MLADVAATAAPVMVVAATTTCRCKLAPPIASIAVHDAARVVNCSVGLAVQTGVEKKKCSQPHQSNARYN